MQQLNPDTDHSRAFRDLALLLCVTLLSACSLINPHVTWDRPATGHFILQDGIEYANRAKDQYKKAVGDQAVLTNLAGVGLIPLGAAALGLGITGGHRNAITALGLTGAAGPRHRCLAQQQAASARLHRWDQGDELRRGCLATIVIFTPRARCVPSRFTTAQRIDRGFLATG